MTTPTSRLAYKMHFDIFDQAMADPKGIRIKMVDQGKANRMRLEFHHARSIDRTDNAMTYEEGHKLHGCSVYDELLLTIEHEDGEVWLHINRRQASAFHIESLSSTATESEAIEEATEEQEAFVERRV